MDSVDDAPQAITGVFTEQIKVVRSSHTKIYREWNSDNINATVTVTSHTVNKNELAMYYLQFFRGQVIIYEDL